MADQPPPSEPPRNRQTEAQHKHESFWQIYAPMGLALIAVAAVCVLAVTATRGEGGGAAARGWATVSLVLLILQAMIVILPLLILCVAGTVGIEYFLRYAPPYFKIAQDYTARAAYEVKRFAPYISEPVLRFRAAVAGFDQFVQNVRRFLGHR